MQANFGIGIAKGVWLLNEDEMYPLNWIRGMAMHDIIMMLLLMDIIF